MTLRAAFLFQAEACRRLDSPFMARLMTLLAARLEPGSPVADRLFSWTGDIGPSGASVPLRLAGALHRLVISGMDGPLAAVYPPNDADDTTLWRAVRGALDRHERIILDWLDSPPQTNEVRRAAVLIAAGNLLARAHGLPMMVSELGASAGLNLNWDRFALQIGPDWLGPRAADVVLTPDWRGAAPVAAGPEVGERRGVDLRPMDMTDRDDRLRLLSYLWPDQPHRRQLAESAIALPAAPVDRADAIDWLDARLAAQPDGVLHMVYHTIAWQYFPRQSRLRGDTLFSRAGARASATRPLARLAMEADGQGPGAAISLTTWPGGQRQDLGRADFHGRWVNWCRPGS